MIRDTDFSNIMEKGYVFYVLNVCFLIAECLCQLRSIFCNTDGMPLGVGILCIDGVCNGRNCLKGKPL